MSFDQKSLSQKDERVPDAEALEEDDRQYVHGPLNMEELDAKYPTRPTNHSKTLPFHDLFISLFNPLNDNKKKPTGPTIARAKQGPHGPSKMNPRDARTNIIERFFSRWRSEVGDDIYPALRLIIPEKDRDRPMYGLKEKAIGRLLVKLMKIDKNSNDAYNLLNWKLPGQSTAASNAGDFAGRCFEVLSKRPMRTEVGDMRIAEVNELLDRLSAAQKEENQLPLFEIFYLRMNADELMWLIRIILREMKIGASEKTILNLWHPDGEALFSISSSLRRVAWELKDHSVRLDSKDGLRVELMSCFQPQLAAFQEKSFQVVVDHMQPTELDPEFWIEEKLDGERIQMHMVEDENTPGGFRFSFWSRKAKDYTYLYGCGFQDENAALTRHIKEAFNPGVRNIILDGELITWDPELDTCVGFGTLKSAALSEQRNPFQGTGIRPLFRAFDILYLNDKDITRYTLRDRRKALERSITDVSRRLEIHKYKKASTAVEIEPELRKVIAAGLEGLVIKNPRSAYMLNERDKNWTKVKPDYMEEFGESLDCVVVGGYYGSGHRGGRLSSFLCGLKVGQNHIDGGANPQKCLSFFKVGGGFRVEDYEKIQHQTQGKWIKYDHKRPPLEYLELAGKNYAQFERPDVWIKPSDSLVVEVKASEVSVSESFRTGYTLRFPRFKRLRTDKDWTTALDEDEFIELKTRVEAKSKEKAFKVDKRRATKKLKKEVVIAGDEEVRTAYVGQTTQVFEHLNFCILSGSEISKPKKTKGELEQLVIENGGMIYQSQVATKDMICVGDKKVVKVASIIKKGEQNIVRPSWLFDTLAQAEIDAGTGQTNFLLPFEPGHMLFTTKGDEKGVQEHVDRYGDSFARDVGTGELVKLLDGINLPDVEEIDNDAFLQALSRHGHEINLKGWMFRRLRIFVDSEDTGPTALQMKLAETTIKFGGGIAAELLDEDVSHIVVPKDSPSLSMLRGKIAGRMRIPRIVTVDWVEDSWREGTLLDEERYAPVGGH